MVAALGGAGGALAAPVAAAALLPAAGLAAAAAARTRRALEQYPAAAPLDRIARAACEAYVALGELRAEAAASLRFEPRASGYLRVLLDEATPEEAERVTGALDALLGPIERPRYLVSRLIAPPSAGPLQLLRIAAGWDGLVVAWHAVPDDLGRRKQRAEAFAGAWRRWLGPAELRFTQRDGPGRAALSEAVAQEWSYDTQRRVVWQ
jgi:hypothetical protein